MPNDRLPELLAFEWDESKRQRNLVKHGIDFEDAVLALSTGRVEYASTRGGEEQNDRDLPGFGKACRRHIHHERKRLPDYLGTRGKRQ